tara:strand:- start:286 stop:501 length:216 start_codon:yes stop_codon:yes gene_type:complete
MKLNGRTLTHPDFDKRCVDGLTQGLDRMFRRGFWRMPAVLWRLRRARHFTSHGPDIGEPARFSAIYGSPRR